MNLDPVIVTCLLALASGEAAIMLMLAKQSREIGQIKTKITGKVD